MELYEAVDQIIKRNLNLVVVECVVHPGKNANSYIRRVVTLTERACFDHTLVRMS